MLPNLPMQLARLRRAADRHHAMPQIGCRFLDELEDLMARYKVLKSVAHSFGHSFVSLMNYRDHDYVMGHLLTQARRTRTNRFVLDILSGKTAPAGLLTPVTADSVESYAIWFPKLVASHRTDLRFIRTAAMDIAFDLNVERRVRGTELLESPFVCRVTIVDDRGKEWTAEIRNWWYPEATGPVGGTAKRRGLVRRLLGRLRGWRADGPQTKLQAAA